MAFMPRRKYASPPSGLPFPLFLPLLLHNPLAAAASSASSLFPPSQEEYDPTVFDPRHMFGAPYGGYARASRSRIAALPLRLVGGAGFDLPPLVVPEEIDGGDNIEDGNEIDTVEVTGTESETAKEKKPVPYFQLSDGQGRRFVCRSYHEDELEAESVTSSMFDAPVLRETPLLTDNEDDEESGGGEYLGDDAAAAAGATRGEAGGAKTNAEYVHQDMRYPSSASAPPSASVSGSAARSGSGDAAGVQSGGEGGEQSAGGGGQAARKSSVPIQASDISAQLSQLEDVCAQIHLGWWSYEWCHEKSTTQFHVNVQDMDKVEAAKKKGRPGTIPGARKFEIESVTNLGKYHSRVVRVDNGKGGRRKSHDAGNGRLTGSIVVMDRFVDGDWCEEASAHRSTDVELRCCGPSDMKAMKALNTAGGEAESQQAQALFRSVSEPPGKVCHYKASICTPLLCADAFQDHEGDEESEEEVLGTIGGEGGGGRGVGAEGADPEARAAAEIVAKLVGGVVVEGDGPIRIFTPDSPQWNEVKPTAGESQGPPSAFREMVKTTSKSRKKGKKESIREILERTLGNHCLQRNAGWWTYELCHTRHVREFHGANKIDMVTGVSRQVVEEEHMLGHYDIDVAEGYPDEDEVNHVINATDPDLTTKKKKFSSSTGAKAAGTPPPPPDAGGNGAVFVQEYLHGDVCEDPDVTDSVVKAGGIVDGGIQRATTVRFSCGKNYELVKVNEDSTCHYVFDVTVPALCKHPLFKAPVVKTQVVKCLPID